MILSSLLLTGCGPERPRLSLPPAELATCAGEPEAPELPARDGSPEVQSIRDQLALMYVLALRSAWGDCHAKVDGLRAWRAAAGG